MVEMNLFEAIERARAFASSRGIQLGERVCGYPDGTKYDPYWELFFEIPGGPADWAWVVWVYQKNSDMEKRPFDWPSDWTQREEWSEPRSPRVKSRQFTLRDLLLAVTIIAVGVGGLCAIARIRAEDWGNYILVCSGVLVIAAALLRAWRTVPYPVMSEAPKSRRPWFRPTRHDALLALPWFAIGVLLAWDAIAILPFGLAIGHLIGRPLVGVQVAAIAGVVLLVFQYAIVK